MGNVGVRFSMSLDGFIAGPNDDVGHVFSWMMSGDTEYTVTIGNQDLTLKMSEQGVKLYKDMAQSTGAIVSGRRSFDVAGAWGGRHPVNVPIFVVTHNVPQEWVDKPGSPFTFVTDGVESAVRQAKAVAGDKNVGVGGADITQQCIRAGLLDEIGIDLVPVVLGSGVRLFENIGDEPLQLESTMVSKDTGVIHLRFRVVK